MKVLMVSYDLVVRGEHDYKDLITAIKSFPSWCRVTKSTWLVKTSLSPIHAANKLRPFLSKGDSLMVLPVTQDRGWATSWLSERVLRWMRQNLSTVSKPSRI